MDLDYSKLVVGFLLLKICCNDWKKNKFSLKNLTKVIISATK